MITENMDKLNNGMSQEEILEQVYKTHIEKSGWFVDSILSSVIALHSHAHIEELEKLAAYADKLVRKKSAYNRKLTDFFMAMK